MSMETLQADLKANIAEAKKLSAMTSMNDLVIHLCEVLWPTIEAITDELAEVDGCVADMVHGAEEILHPESGALLSAVVAGAATLATAMMQRVTKESDPKLYQVSEELLKNCAAAAELLEEIVLEDEEDDDEGEGDAEGDDEDDDENEGAE